MIRRKKPVLKTNAQSDFSKLRARMGIAFWPVYSAALTYILLLAQYETAAGVLKTASAFPHAVYLTFGLVLILSGIAYFITYRPSLMVLVTYPPLALSTIASGIKLFYRGAPIVATDIILLREAVNITSEFTFALTQPICIAITAFVALFGLALILGSAGRRGLKKRILSALLALCLGPALLYAGFFMDSPLVRSVYQNVVWNLRDEYNRNGFLPGFFHSFYYLKLVKPENYGAEAVEAAAQALGYRPGEKASGPDTRPNIIVVMNESMWDAAAQAPGLGAAPDPMAFMRAAGGQEDATLSHHLSSATGGGTCNVEYEFLTGKFIYFYPTEAMPYQTHIAQKTWALPWYFQDLGYRTVAVHPYASWFWRRKEVYPLLGFEQMEFQESFPQDVLRYGGPNGYISDQALADRILEHTEEADSPLFLFAVTMQNHGPYTNGRYEDLPPHISAQGSLPEEAREETETYLEGLYYADQMVAQLVEGLSAQERPTYLLVFGDHIPPFPIAPEVYAEGAPVDFLFRRCPAFIWSNTGKPISDFGAIGTPFLGGQLLRAAGLPLPPYFEMLETVRGQMAGIAPPILLDGEHHPVPREEQGTYKPLLDQLFLLQYDATYGNHYVVDEFAE